MDRLISADALMREVETLISNNKQLIDEWFANVITDAIDDAPTVDAEPVRHGHWIKSEDADDGYCSVCECDMPMYREDWEWKYSETPFCPNCGARMQEVD